MTDLATRADVIATVHRLHLSLADKCRAEANATAEDVAIAAAYAALDASTALAGDKATGITWLRAMLTRIEAAQPLAVETLQ